MLLSDAEYFFPFPHTFHSFLAKVNGSAYWCLYYRSFCIYLPACLLFQWHQRDMVEVFTAMNGLEEVTCTPPLTKHKITDLQAWAGIKCAGFLPFSWASGLARKRLNVGICPTYRILQSTPLQGTAPVASLRHGLLWSFWQQGALGPAGRQGSSSPFKLITSQENTAYCHKTNLFGANPSCSTGKACFSLGL